MVTRRTDAEKAARATSRRERRREPIPTRGRVDTRAPAVPRLQHNASDVEHDSNEGRIQSPVSNNRAQTDLNDGSSPTKVKDVASPSANPALLPAVRLGRLTPRTPIHHTSQEEEDEESEPGPTAFEIIQGIHKPRGPADYWLLDIFRPQPSSPRPQPATPAPSSPLRGAEMMALAAANRNGNRLFERLAENAIEWVLRVYYSGVALDPTAMRMIMEALRVGRISTRTTWRTLVHIIRRVIPRTLATTRDILTAEKTPVGSDRAPVPGAYPIAAEGTVAAEATSVDHVEPESASLPTLPLAARPQFRLTRPNGPLLARTRASEQSYPNVRTPDGMAFAMAQWRAAGIAVDPIPAYAKLRSKRLKFLDPYDCSATPGLLSARSAWSKSPFKPHGPGSVHTVAPRSKLQTPVVPRNHKKTPPQFSCLGPYWAENLSPFLGTDGKELPILKLTPDQLEFCRGLVQKVAPNYYLQAAVMLVRDDDQLLVAMRVETEPSPSSDDRGLVTMGSSDNGSTWDFVKATNERDDLTRVLYLSESREDLAHLQNASSSFSTTNGWNSSISFLLRDNSVVKGSLVYHEDYSLTFVLADGSILDGALVESVVEYGSAMDVDESMTDAFD